jgi:predicted GH43/DUF377 family glycosyl hydrolase/DNA-binding MarR family transcriptional regulator
MRPRSRTLPKAKKYRYMYKGPVFWLFCFLVTIQLMVVSLSTAAPVTANVDCGGSWCDDFSDGKGVEAYDNLTITDRQTNLLPMVEGTDWVKQGVAVPNRGLYDMMYAKNPCVIKDQGIYKMWYAGNDGSNVRILYAESSDGINWDKTRDPVVDLGDPGEPDDTHVDVPKVIKEDGTYKMWYAGNDSVDSRIMFATSDDGLTWTKLGVVITDYGLRPNTVIHDGGVYKMWYQAFEDGHWKIFYAESTDGREWAKKGLALDIGDPSEPDDMHVSGAAVIKESDDLYRMWYSGHNEEEGYRILYAASSDETNWVRQGLAIDMGMPGENDDNGSAYPCVMKDDDGHYKIWYSGIANGWDVDVMFAVNSPTFMEFGYLRSVKIPLPQGQSWRDLSIEKIEPGPNNYIRVSVLDGATGEEIQGFEDLEGTSIDLTAIKNTTHPTIRLKAVFTGDGSETPILNEWKVTWQETITPETITPTSSNVKNLWPGMGPAAAGGIILFSLGFAWSTEVGKYRLFPIISPLYTRLKKKEVLDQFTRGRIFEYIRGHPGDHYNAIKLELDLNNGVLSHHLRMLERESFIKSMRDGMYKRFYPVDAKISKINGHSLYSIQGRMMEAILNHPGLTQKEVSTALDASQQVVSYHVKLLMDSGQIKAERHGKTFRYFPI